MYYARVCARVFVDFPLKQFIHYFLLVFFLLNNAATAFVTYLKGAFVPDKLEQVKKEQQQTAKSDALSLVRIAP